MASTSSETRSNVGPADGGFSMPVKVALKPALDALYDSFAYPESAVDPVQIVRRYGRVDDREIVAFIAAGLAFGRVASVIASVEAVCRELGERPAEFVRTFDPAADNAGLLAIGHRWIRGRDVVALLWILRRLVNEHGSIESSLARHLRPTDPDIGQALNAWCDEVRRMDLRPAYGSRVPALPGVWSFFARPSTGSACKRLNLFLRWMVRHDAVDPGGWTTIRPAALVVPLDTHTMRLGRCLRLTRRASPGWKMAADITRSLAMLDSSDPVQYDFSLCHLGMMGGCGWDTTRGNRHCPLRAHCHPRRRRRARSVRGAVERS